ncbi:hypothetical protein [Tahibacter amnicola]|uniref:DUF4375 domain-containing protein n=1 Tax=Tahibacter amnicola TaxID=2976241 RepID=A0ABY6BHG1_9GAMM|nr:hypothetical protein [Tahibacter amnicola]UXI68947.1 hypothetical protein N4264_04630 [Tahibacter amnicola]
MRLPEEIVPVLNETLRHCAPGTPLEIWRGDDHHQWISNFAALADQLELSELIEDDLPRGFGLVCHALGWEAACQCEGWHAFSNKADSLDRIYAALEEVGLADEASALKRAAAVWFETGGDLDATAAAYSAASIPHMCDLDRMEHMVCYFVDHADRLFYRR